MEKSGKTLQDALAASLKGAFEDTLEEDLPEPFRSLIDDNLKKGVEETLQEGIPDRFRDLLNRLETELGGGDAP